MNSTTIPLIHANSLLVAHPTDDLIAVVDSCNATKTLPWFQGDPRAIDQWWTQRGGLIERKCAWLYGDLVLGTRDLWLQTWVLSNSSDDLPEGWQWISWEDLLKKTPSIYKNHTLNLRHAWKRYLLASDMAILKEV